MYAEIFSWIYSYICICISNMSKYDWRLLVPSLSDWDGSSIVISRC